MCMCMCVWCGVEGMHTMQWLAVCKVSDASLVHSIQCSQHNTHFSGSRDLIVFPPMVASCSEV
jgi:hypothetical protein